MATFTADQLYDSLIKSATADLLLDAQAKKRIIDAANEARRQMSQELNKPNEESLKAMLLYATSVLTEAMVGNLASDDMRAPGVHDARVWLSGWSSAVLTFAR